MREAAAPSIVTQAEHYLLAVELHGGQALFGRTGRLLTSAREKAATVNLQCADGFGKARGLPHDTVVRLHRKRGAVVDDLIVATDLVHVQDGQRMAPGCLTEYLVALLAFAQLAGAGVDADHHVGRGVSHALERVGGVVGTGVVPAVFADQKAHLGICNAQHLGHVAPRLEMAALIEDVVSGQ